MIQTKEYRPRLFAGQRLAFSLRANPVRVRRVSDDPNAPSWGTTGGELTIDNLFTTGVSFDAANRHTLTVAYKDL